MKYLKKGVFLISMLLLSVFTYAQQFTIGTNCEKTTIYGSTETTEVIGQIDITAARTYQRGFLAFEESLLKERKIKRKQKIEVLPKEYTGFALGNRYFQSMKVLIPAPEGAKPVISPKWSFLERTKDGTITLYEGYAIGPDGQSVIYFLEKEGMKTRSLGDVNFINWISDNQEIADKFRNGEYGNFKRKKDKGIANFLKGRNENLSIYLKIIDEYNAKSSQ